MSSRLLVGSAGLLAAHGLHLLVFGPPAVILAVVVGFQELRGRRSKHAAVAASEDRPSTDAVASAEPRRRWPAATAANALRWFPRGRPLPESIWARRHRSIVRFALGQAVAVAIFGWCRGFALVLCLMDLAIVGLPALFARSHYSSRRLRTIAATTSLMMASVTIVDLAGGATEAHFHFFVMVGIVALYQDWTAFAVCIVITVVHHAIMGELVPRDVYGSTAEQHDPILWAFVHGGFVLAAAFTHVLAWRNNELQALSDPLTLLPNRTAFTERLTKVTADLRQVATVLFVDLDHFKNINDSFGHAMGDHALQAAAQRMTACLRQTDVLARLGGDEFAIVVQGPAAFGPALANRILEALQPPVVIDGISVFVQASIGVADTEQARSRNSDDLVRCADLAMYMAKSSGKNVVVVYDEAMDHAVRERAELAASLAPALADGQFHLVYQPVVTGDDGTLVGMEALLRWQHPTLGSIAPVTFIPLAEETGDIKAIGPWVLHTAAVQIVEWNRLRPEHPELTLAVNASPVQLGQPDFVESVLSILEISGLRPDLLVLEVTEGLRLYDWTGSCRRLNELRDRGVKVAIDDFGTGYSSLSYLDDLPADILKIDRSFVHNLESSPASVVLVRAVMAMAKSFGLEVIAEGVETLDQQAVLSELGCLHAQGYLHSRPLPPEAMATLLNLSSEPDAPAPDLARAASGNA